MLCGCVNSAKRNYLGTYSIANDTINLYLVHQQELSKTNIACAIHTIRDSLLLCESKERFFMHKAYIDTLKSLELNSNEKYIVNYFYTQYLNFIYFDIKVPMQHISQALFNGTELVLDWFDDTYRFFSYKETFNMNTGLSELR